MMDRLALLTLIDQALYRLENWIIAIFTVAAFLLGVMQVVLRYVFNTGIEWSEGVFVLLTIAAMLAAGSRAVREDAHVRMDLLAQHVSAKPKKALLLIAHLAALLLCLYFAWAGYEFVLFAHEMETVSPETGIADWVAWLIIPFSMGAFSVRYLLVLNDIWHDRQIAHKEVRE